MNVLVTGGAGFIGSHVCELALERGHRVRVLDNLSTGNVDWVPTTAEFVEGDIRDFEVFSRAAMNCSAIIHLAAMARSGPSALMLDECVSSNVVGVANLIATASTHGIKRIVYSASSTYYGSSGVPNCVQNRPNFLNYSGFTKYAGEELLNLFARENGTDVVNLRYFNVYGPRQPRVGIYALVIGIFLEAVAAGQALEIHGDGMQRRDFVHVRDVARVNLFALEKPVDSPVTLNVGSGANTSILELAALMSSNFKFGPRREGDAQDTLADISETVQVLGWQPTISLSTGLSELLHGT